MALTRALAFDGVAFSYGNVAALSDVSFEIAPAQRVALVGASGKAG